MMTLAADAEDATHVVLPGDRRAEAEAVIALRLAELAEDLRLPRIPALSTEAGEPPSAQIGRDAVRIPRAPRQSRHSPSETASALGERVAAALIQARQRLLLSALRRNGATIAPSAHDAIAMGASLSELRTLSANPDADHAMWALSERLPRSVALLTPEPAASWTNIDAIAEFSAELAGFDLPTPLVEQDVSLSPGTARLRMRGLRGPVVRFDPTDAVAAALAYARQSALLLDAVAVTALLLNADSGSKASFPELLRRVSAPSLAVALKPLVAAGFGVPAVPALVRAVLAPAAPVGDPTERRLVLPGYVPAPIDGDATNGLRDRLRMASVTGALLKRMGGGGQTVSVWVAPPTLAESLTTAPPTGLRLDLLVEAAHPAMSGRFSALLAPAGYGSALWELLMADLPELIVVEGPEFPPTLEARQRGILKLEEEKR
jgi:hypothetical protein